MASPTGTADASISSDGALVRVGWFERHRVGRAVRRNLVGYTFLLPWIIGFLGLTLGPMLASLYLSFTKYDLLSDPRWVGLDNYAWMLQDERWWASVRVTLSYVVLEVPLKLAFALLVAIVLNRGLAAMSLYRSIYYVPSLLGGSVAVAILWRQVFGPEGLVNQFSHLVGIAHPPIWVVDPDYVLYTIVLLGVWQFGSPMVIFLAGLRQIPKELYEAAMVDGAGRFHRFRHVTLPLLTPIIFFNLVLQLIHSFHAFTPAFIISNGTGGPVNRTLFYTLYLYQQGFAHLRMGHATAMAWVLLVFVALFTTLAFATSRYWVFYQDRQG
jgi:multiple sugar transport system permease protein